MSSGAVAAAVIIRSERRIVSALREQGATSPAGAVALHPPRLVQRGALRRLIRNDAVVEAGEDLYWLDEDAYRAFRNRRRVNILMMVLVVVVIAAFAMAYVQLRA